MTQPSASSNDDLKLVEESSNSNLQNVDDKEVSEVVEATGCKETVQSCANEETSTDKDIGKSDGAIKNVGEEKQAETNKVTDGDQSGDNIKDTDATDAAKVEAIEDNGKDPNVGEEPKPGSGALVVLKSKISDTVAKIGDSAWFAMLLTVIEYLRSLFRMKRNSSGRE